MTNDRNMGNIGTANQSNLVSAHGIFNNIIEEMKKEIEDNWPLTDEQWDKIIEKVTRITEFSSDNPSVTEKLVNFLETYSEKEKEIEKQKEYEPKI